MKKIIAAQPMLMLSLPQAPDLLINAGLKTKIRI